MKPCGSSRGLDGIIVIDGPRKPRILYASSSCFPGLEPSLGCVFIFCGVFSPHYSEAALISLTTTFREKGQRISRRLRDSSRLVLLLSVLLTHTENQIKPGLNDDFAVTVSFEWGCIVANFISQIISTRDNLIVHPDRLTQLHYRTPESAGYAIYV
jgi:hypothetical protein